MILFLSSRYAFPRSRALRSRSIRIMLTVTLSLVVVTVVMAVMNYLQSSRFDAIRDVRSFDCTVEGDYAGEIRELLPSSVVFTYGEGEALSESGSYLVRYIDSTYEGGLSLYYGDSSSLVVPYSFYRQNGLKDISLSMLRSGRAVTTLKSIDYTISGIYYTELGSEFDDTMLFLPLSDADENVTMKTAVRGAGEKEIELLKEKGYSVTRWQEAESSLYGAFLVEKTLMYAVLSLLFVIIAVSIKSSAALFSRSREKEMAELEILGLGKRRTNGAALLSFLIVILLGIVLALILGEAVLYALETFSQNSSLIITMTLSLPKAGFTFFSLFMIAVTFIFVSIENRKRGKRELYEVIHAE